MHVRVLAVESVTSVTSVTSVHSRFVTGTNAPWTAPDGACPCKPVWRSGPEATRATHLLPSSIVHRAPWTTCTAVAARLKSYVKSHSTASPLRSLDRANIARSSIP